MIPRYLRWLARGTAGLVRDYPWTCLYGLAVTLAFRFGGQPVQAFAFLLVFGLAFVYFPIRLFEISQGNRLVLHVAIRDGKPSISTHIERLP